MPLKLLPLPAVFLQISFSKGFIHAVYVILEDLYSLVIYTVIQVSMPVLQNEVSHTLLTVMK